MPESSHRSSGGRGLGLFSGTLLFLLLGALGGWSFLANRSRPEHEPQLADSDLEPALDVHEPMFPEPERDAEPGAIPEDLVTAPQSTSLPERALTPDQRRLLNPLGDPGRKHTFEGQILDSSTRKPVMFFELILVPAGEEDVRTAANSGRSQKFRNVEGKFALQYQKEGTYDLLVRTQDHKDWVQEGVEIPQREPLTVLLDRGAWIDGTVRDNYGMPLEGMEVFLHPVKLDPGLTPPLKRLARTSKTGYFEFSNLPPGVYTMSAGPVGDPATEHAEFYLGTDQHLDRSFQLQRRTTVTVRVFREGGLPVPRARVSLLSEAGSSTRAEYTDINGEARLMFVSGGVYSLKVRASGYENFEQSLHVNDGDLSREVDCQLTVLPSR